MNSEGERAEKVLTENGRILAVGSFSDEGIDGERIDLKGKTLMPGFVDGHSHMIGYGLSCTSSCDLTGASSFDEILERIMEYKRKKGLEDDEPISCRGYDPALLKEGRHPDAAVLDRTGLKNPISCIHISGHMAAYNTAAMEKAGVFSMDYVCPEGGFAGRKEDGTLSGYFEETAKRIFTPIFEPKDPEKAVREAVLEAQKRYIQNGFTTVQEGSANTAARLRTLERLAGEGALQVDVVAYMSAAEGLQTQRQALLESIGTAYRNRFRLGGVKLFLDGSPQAKTAWLSRPYEGEASYCGYPTLQSGEVEDRLRLAVELGLQPLAHCNGDAASEQFLDAWEKISPRGKYASLRPVMVHAQTVRRDQLDRMSRLGMMASFFIGHCWYWGDTHRQNLGARANCISPAASALSRGVPFSFHQDSPVTEPNMLFSVWCAVNRCTRSGVILGEEEKLTPYRALQTATAGGAYGYFEEEKKGVLKPGALADFLILDADPTQVSPETIKDVSVLATIKEDRVLYQKE